MAAARLCPSHPHDVLQSVFPAFEVAILPHCPSNVNSTDKNMSESIELTSHSSNAEDPGSTANEPPKPPTSTNASNLEAQLPTEFPKPGHKQHSLWLSRVQKHTSPLRQYIPNNPKRAYTRTSRWVANGGRSSPRQLAPPSPRASRVQHYIIQSDHLMTHTSRLTSRRSNTASRVRRRRETYTVGITWRSRRDL
jgi:hypothetical protein